MNEVKQWQEKVIQQTCEQLQLSEEIVSAVVKDQFKRGRTAIKTCNQVQFCGFGAFKVIPHRVHKQLYKFENYYKAWSRLKEEEPDPGKIHSLDIKMEALEPHIENLRNRKTKLENEIKP